MTRAPTPHAPTRTGAAENAWPPGPAGRMNFIRCTRAADRGRSQRAIGLPGRATMAKRLFAAVFALAAAMLLRAPSVSAHGEAGDQPFLKDLTAAFYDVKISPTQIEVGQPVTVTGKVRILETWPYTLDPPQTAYITPVVPEPVFALKDRTVNGQSAPGSFFVDRNGVYRFKMVLLGREPGRWHVHPGIAIQGTGTLIGPGEWVDVQPAATG